MDDKKGYDKAYRERHPERVKQQRLACYLKYREQNLAKKRAYYEKNKERILAMNKADVQLCPICKINYKRLYLTKHLENRHNLRNDTPSTFTE